MSLTRSSLLASALVVALAQTQASPQAIPAGTPLHIEIETGVSTRYSKALEDVHAKLLDPVKKDGQVVIPAGTRLLGHIETVQASDRKDKLRSSVRLVFESFNLPNQRALQSRIVIQNAGFGFRVDPEGNVTRPGLSQDFELKRGRRVWARLSRALDLAGGEAETAAGSSVSLSEGSEAAEGRRQEPERRSATAVGPARRGQSAGTKDKYSVRMGEFLVTGSAIDPHASPDAPLSSSSSLGHHFVVVHVKVRNVSKQFPCTVLDALLRVDPYYEYQSEKGPPDLRELLPGEETEGAYVFRVRDGTTPVTLVLKASETSRLDDEQRCRQHPDWGSIWHARTTASIPLQGLPSLETSKD